MPKCWRAPSRLIEPSSDASDAAQLALRELVGRRPVAVFGPLDLRDERETSEANRVVEEHDGMWSGP